MKTKSVEQMNAVGVERRHAELPAQPRSIEETGLSFQFLVELITKAL